VTSVGSCRAASEAAVKHFHFPCFLPLAFVETSICSADSGPSAKMVLNRDSEHPNPYRNVMPYNQQTLATWQARRIYKGHPDSLTDVENPFKRKFNFMTDSTFSKRMYVAAKKSFLVSTGIGIIDVVSVTEPKTRRAQIARVLYFNVPATTAAVSYVASRDFLGNVSLKLGGKWDDYWTFFGAAFAPGLICGAWRKKYPHP